LQLKKVRKEEIINEIGKSKTKKLIDFLDRES